MKAETRDVVVIFGRSEWPQLDAIIASIPQDTPIIKASDAADAVKQVSCYVPCRVTFLPPPDVSETLVALEWMRRSLNIPVTMVDPYDDERVERFCRLAGCTEYYSTTLGSGLDSVLIDDEWIAQEARSAKKPDAKRI